MLDGLDGIDWHGLQHAYGRASDIPKILREVAAEAKNKKEREKRHGAVWALYSTLCHQGSVYSATAPAVPFLADFATSPSGYAKDRMYLLRLLGDVANGHSWHQVHAEGSDPASIEVFAAVRQQPGYAEKLAEERRWVREAREAVRREVPRIVTLLDDPDEQVRRGAAYALWSVPEERAVSLPAVRARYATETDLPARAMLLTALGTLMAADAATGDAPPEPVWKAAGAPDTPDLLRITAAVFLWFRMPEWLPDPAVDILFLCYAHPSPVWEEYGTLGLDIGHPMGEILERLPSWMVDNSVERLCSAADAAEDRERAAFLWRAALTAAPYNQFAGVGPADPPPVEEHTPRRVGVVTAILNSETFWERDLGGELERFRLPQTRPELRAFLGGT